MGYEAYLGLLVPNGCMSETAVVEYCADSVEPLTHSAAVSLICPWLVAFAIGVSPGGALEQVVKSNGCSNRMMHAMGKS